MKQKPTISIIIPIYNAEEYLERCLESILKQTCGEYELILIDDGSKDDSPAICDRYAEKENITVKHLPNAGVSVARNTGVSMAAGEYIAFIDADDYVKEDYLEKLLECAQKEKADISVCGRIVVSEKAEDEKEIPVEAGVFENEKKSFLLQEMLGYSYADMKRWLKLRNFSRGTVVWGRLYRAELFQKNKLRFDADVKIAEDMLFNTRAYLLANRIAQTAYCGYYYFQQEQSAIHKYLKGDYRLVVDNKCQLAIQREKIAQQFEKETDIRPMYQGSLVLSCAEIAVSLSGSALPFSEKKRLYYSYSDIPSVAEARKNLSLQGLSVKYAAALFLIQQNGGTLLLFGLQLCKLLHIKVGL